MSDDEESFDIHLGGAGATVTAAEVKQLYDCQPTDARAP
jgi:hypothetical protein